MVERLLVVEDDAANAILIQFVLSRLGGFEVEHSDDGDQVLEAVRSGGFAAVLMDVSLRNTTVAGEKVDGLELTRRLRDLPEGKNLPVILLTAHAMQGDRERLLFTSGANDYVSKPITDQHGFIDLVRRHIRSSGEMAALAEDDASEVSP